MSVRTTVRIAFSDNGRTWLLTDVVGAAAGALVTDDSRRGLAVGGVLYGDLVIAVLAVAVDVARDRNDLVAVLVGLSAGTEADVEPSALDGGSMSACITGWRRRRGTYTAGAGPLLDGTRRVRRRCSDDGDDESEQESDDGEARHGAGKKV